jgi:hypothetical protein
MGERLYNKFTGITAALILLSTTHYLYYSRNGMLDISVTFFMLASLYFFYKGIHSSRTLEEKLRSGKQHLTSLEKSIYKYFNKIKLQTILYILSGVFIGLAVMTKAVIGLLPFGAIVLYSLYVKFIKKENVNLLRLVLIIISSLIVFMPWHLYSYLKHGQEFLDSYLIKHILGRGLSGLGHEKPFWWFLEVIKVSFRIWIFPLMGGLILLPFIDKRKRKELVFLLINALMLLVFFSISKDKLQWYIIPIYPFIALLSARFIERITVLSNSLLRKEVAIDYKYLRIFVLFVLFVASTFYVILIRDRVYYRDTNKNKVALVKINNELFPKKRYPDRPLYFTRDSSPALSFYSDHEIRQTNEEKILEKIDDAPPFDDYTFLLQEEFFYGLVKKQSEIEAPLSFDIKGAVEGWMLVKSKSRVEVLKERFNEVNKEWGPLFFKKYNSNVKLTPQEEIDFGILDKEYNEILSKLAEYGTTP